MNTLMGMQGVGLLMTLIIGGLAIYGVSRVDLDTIMGRKR